MTIDMPFAVFTDFNEDRETPVSPPTSDEPSIGINEVSDAWTEGYIAGRRRLLGVDPPLVGVSRLLTSLNDLDCKTAEAIDFASLLVANLLINTVIALSSDDWARKLPMQVRIVADRIMPHLLVEPEFLLRDGSGSERRFGDIVGLFRALENDNPGEDVSIRWQRGEATINPTALLNDLREATIPLLAGFATDKEAEQPL
jgi:hypothetical protein